MCSGIRTSSMPPEDIIDKSSHKHEDKQESSVSATDTVVPTELDVLMGKGRKIQNHEGNVRLREIGRHFSEKYQGQPNAIKQRIRQQVVDLVRKSGGRFLELVAEEYVDVGDKRAMEKVRHVMSGRLPQPKGDNCKYTFVATESQAAQASSEQPEVTDDPLRDTREKSETIPKHSQINTYLCQEIGAASIAEESVSEEEEKQNNAEPEVPLCDIADEAVKVRQRQQRLLLLRHGATCKHNSQRCPVTDQCAKFKALWGHMATCQDANCQVRHCISSKYMLHHYKHCSNDLCLECGPLRATIAGARRKRQESNDEKPCDEPQLKRRKTSSIFEEWSE